MPLSGYRRVPGKARRYVTPTGKEISRYEYDSRRARAAGFRNRGELERFRTGKGAAWEFRLLEKGKRGDWNALGAAKQILARRANLPSRYDVRSQLSFSDDGDDPILVAPDGPLAMWLVAMGYRDRDDFWNVGDTNGAMR